MKVFLTILILTLLLILGLMVGAQNDQFVEVNYLIARSEVRLSVLMAVLVLGGAVLGVLVFSVVWLRLRWKVSQLTRKQALSNQTKAP